MWEVICWPDQYKESAGKNYFSSRLMVCLASVPVPVQYSTLQYSTVQCSILWCECCPDVIQLLSRIFLDVGGGANRRWCRSLIISWNIFNILMKYFADVNISWRQRSSLPPAVREWRDICRYIASCKPPAPSSPPCQHPQPITARARVTWGGLSQWESRKWGGSRDDWTESCQDSPRGTQTLMDML